MQTHSVITNDEALEQLKLWMAQWARSNIDPKYIIDNALPHLERKKNKPHQFSNIEKFREAVKLAKADSNDFYSNSTQIYELKYLVEKSVDNTTFRSLPLKNKGSERRPSDIYHEYTVNLLKDKHKEFKSISDLETYATFVKCAARELEEIFDTEVRESGFLGFGRATKMLNLSFKFAL